MNKKIIISFLTLALFASAGFAQGAHKISLRDTQPSPEVLQKEKNAAETIQNQAQAKNQKQAMAENIEQLKVIIQEKKQEMNQEIQAIGDEKEQKIYQNQNQVREAVHALLATEDLAGGIGPQISEIAREFNNSVNKTVQAEEKIENRGGFTKFLFGGDKTAAEEIIQEVGINKLKIQQLKNLQKQSECNEEIKEIIQGQIQNMEQEQNRLKQLANKEKSKKGIFGWLFGWL